MQNSTHNLLIKEQFHRSIYRLNSVIPIPQFILQKCLLFYQYFALQKNILPCKGIFFLKFALIHDVFEILGSGYPLPPPPSPLPPAPSPPVNSWEDFRVHAKFHRCDRRASASLGVHATSYCRDRRAKIKFSAQRHISLV